MTKIKKLLSVIIFISISLFINSSFAVSAKVTAAGTYDTGGVFVFFNTAILPSCSTTHSRIDLSENHPALKNVLAIAMTAFTTNSNVIINPGSCLNGIPQFSIQGDSFIYLTK